jgi:hypothetical protein
MSSTDFNCQFDARHEVVIQLPRDIDDMGQEILILVVTNEGVVFDFYNDGELTSTVARTYEEWYEEAQAVIASRANHPANSDVDVWKAFQKKTLK